MTWVSRFSGICDLLAITTRTVQFYELKDFVRYCEQLLYMAEDITVLKTNLKEKQALRKCGSLLSSSSSTWRATDEDACVRLTGINIVN